LFSWSFVYLIWLLEYLSEKLPEPTKLATDLLNKAISWNALLRMLMVRIRRYLKSVLRYVFSFGYYHPDPLYLVSMDMRICGFFFRNQNGSARKKLVKYCSRLLFDRCPVCIVTKTLDTLRLSSFTSDLQANSGRLIRLWHDRFLSYPLDFISNRLS
jgi:hypothetical protein